MSTSGTDKLLDAVRNRISLLRTRLSIAHADLRELDVARGTKMIDISHLNRELEQANADLLEAIIRRLPNVR